MPEQELDPPTEYTHVVTFVAELNTLKGLASQVMTITLATKGEDVMPKDTGDQQCSQDQFETMTIEHTVILDGYHGDITLGEWSGRGKGRRSENNIRPDRNACGFEDV